MPALKEFQMIAAYAYAVAEQNADNGTVVTAPTCGACGVLPAVLKYAQVTRNFTDEEICRGLATAGIIGNLTKTNASISGAECGCQAEIGTACSMAAAALAELYGQNLDQVEYAAEVAMEHHLGLTCDPICDDRRNRPGGHEALCRGHFPGSEHDRVQRSYLLP